MWRLLIFIGSVLGKTCLEDFEKNCKSTCNNKEDECFYWARENENSAHTFCSMSCEALPEDKIEVWPATTTTTAGPAPVSDPQQPVNTPPANQKLQEKSKAVKTFSSWPVPQPTPVMVTEDPVTTRPAVAVSVVEQRSAAIVQAEEDHQKTSLRVNTWVADETKKRPVVNVSAEFLAARPAPVSDQEQPPVLAEAEAEAATEQITVRARWIDTAQLVTALPARPAVAVSVRSAAGAQGTGQTNQQTNPPNLPRQQTTVGAHQLDNATAEVNNS